MSKIALIEGNSVHHVWPVGDGETELAIRFTLPDGSQISPVSVGWANDTYAIVAVSEFVVPEGKVITGAPSYSVDAGAVIETYPVDDAPVYRPMVRKSIVQQRLIEAGKMNAVYAALTSNAAYFARWFAPDRPAVYCDDPDALILLAAIGADPSTILAEE